MASADWAAIEHEYVCGNCTYADLARKYNVHPTMVGKHASDGGWRKKREKYREKTTEKVIEKAAKNKADKLTSLQNSADKLAERIAALLEDESAFNRYLVEVGSGRGQYETGEQIFSRVDTKMLRDTVMSLKELSVAMRNLYGLPTEQEKATISIARERLEIERIKAAAGQSGGRDDTGVILLPEAGDDDGH